MGIVRIVHILSVLLTLVYFFSNPTYILAVNLLQNSSFENSTDGWTVYGSNISTSTDYKKSGNYSGKIQTSTTNSGVKYVYQVVPVIAGKSYKASGFAVKQGETNATTFIRFAFYTTIDGSGTQIDGNYYTSNILTDNSNQFQYLESPVVEVPLTANSSRIRLSIEMPGGASQVGLAYFDDLSFEEVSPSPTSTPTPTSTPLPTSTSTPTATPPPTSIPTSSPSLTITNVPSQTSVNQEFPVSITLTNFPINTNYYLKGAFKKAGGSNYFGQTLVSGSWVKNSETYTQQFPITTDSSGSWSGILSVRGDPDDSGFTGQDDYIFKVGYYQDSSISWSNETTIHLNNLSPPSPTPSSPSNRPTINTHSPSLAATTLSSLVKTTKLALPPSILGASKSAEATKSPSKVKTETKPENRDKFVYNILAVGGGLILILSGLLRLTFLVKKKPLKL